MAIYIRTLGAPGVEGDEEIDLPLGKPFGILVYLSLSSSAVSRDELAELFWSDSDRSRARQSVRQALSYLRKQLGEEIFTSDDPVALDPFRVHTDVEAVEEALAAEDPESALRRYSGPFLEGVQLSSSTEWEHWTERRRRVLAERVGALLHQAAAEAEDAGEAAVWLERAVEVEPHRALHRAALIERRLERGELEEATAALAEARQADLDDPERAEEVAQRVEQRRVARERGGEEEAWTPSLVGRSATLTALVDRWKRARAGGREIAVLSGPAGIGLTRVTEELAAIVRSDGGSVARITAAPAEQRLEWSVTAELIRTLYGMPGAAGISGGTESVLRSLVPSLGSPRGDAAPSNVRPVAVSDALADLIEAVAYEAPLLVVLDDMQWVDRSSISLLRRAARQIAGQPVLVVFTLRSEEVSAAGLEFLRELVREEDALSLQLPPLSTGEVEELLSRSGFEEEPERLERLAERLHGASRGNPLFLVELLRSLQDEGTLVRRGNGWRLSGATPDQLELPATLKTVIDRRLGPLSDEARRVGGVLASAAPEADPSRIRLRSGLDAEAFDRGLRELLHRDVVRWDAGDRLHFSHEQLRTAMARAERRGRQALVAAAALIGIIALIAGLRLLTPATPVPYGGGTILVWPGSDSLVALRPDHDDPARWDTLDQPPFWTPEPVANQYGPIYPWRLANGDVVWTGRIQDPEQAPDGVLYRRGSPPRVVVDRPGDDNIVGVSPDGERLLVASERLETPGYDLDLRLVPVDSGPGRVLAGPANGASGAWSRDGRRVAVVRSHGVDSLLVMSPAGDRTATWTAFVIGTRGWCGGSRHLLLDVQESPTEPGRRILLDTETMATTVVDSFPTRAAACAPDGTAVIGARQIRGQTTWHLYDLTTGERSPLSGVFTGDLANVVWLPDSLPPIPAELRIQSDTILVAHGDRQTLAATLVMEGGSARSDPAVEWRSEDPGIASILPGGRLSANRVGTTRIEATYDHWLRDTVVVRVVGGDQPALLLADDFTALDTTRWYLVGHPVAEPVRLDDGPALELLGDGRYEDGLVSRDSFFVPRGATLEMAVRFPLTAAERQDLDICLVTLSPPADAAQRHMFSLWEAGPGPCFHYPAFELQKWSPDLFKFQHRTGRYPGTPFPPESDIGDWIRLGIQILPDGHASLWLDGQRAAELEVPSELMKSPFRISIMGGTDGTRGFIRGLRLWAEPRYR